MDLPEEEDKPGIPAWVVTFADLMSLLMCFFVLLLSFSEIDAAKFKQIAGELSKAFGVQRDVPATEIPMGTSPIFNSFSPSVPEPTLVENVRQETSQEAPQLDTLRADRESSVAQQVEQTTREQIEVSLDALSAVLQQELTEGRLQLEHDRKRVIVRVEEKGSFPSGSADMTTGFEEVLWRIADVLAELPGEITIEGHTDNIPISTPRFRSNWDLSAARASSVANALLASETVEPERIRVQGYADTRPRASNDWPDTRTLNRRVEIILDLTGPIQAYEEQLRKLMQAESDSVSAGIAPQPASLPDAGSPQVMP
ncbi:chemotaxis protein MotB [Halopseudomonas xinjiangensis]|uniref:Chemotaxis protein MotB n=1 Tax=Halopseudomonas xinjiangensis TaxID=487184 RepID=A0A1H1MT52_9GAMM|nr:MotB family protein [Halopseudomonas xinjiangensis]SDR89954.1 chemotaxis protein MotB [Halopseudomonas xinjiangensis]